MELINQAVRSLQSDNEQLQRTVNVNREMIEHLENDKDDLERKLLILP